MSPGAGLASSSGLTLGFIVSPGTGFVVCFGLTLALLGVVVVTGLKARRALHLTCVVLTVAALGATIYYAYGLGKIYDLAAAGWITPVHLSLARANTVALLVPVVTGIRTMFVPATRALHRRMAFLVIGLTVLTAITGAWMLWLAPKFPA
ncbi:MAG: hypothetical protein IPJ77_18245 [Planctomycetes bacterium]|nr:hypothetical protein [Planctomycetota bacterium]